MSDFATCIKLLDLGQADRAEIEPFVVEAGGEAEGVTAYLSSVVGELATMRGQIAKALNDGGEPPALALTVSRPRSEISDVLDQVPIGRMVDEVENREIAQTVSRQELAAELDADDEFVEQMGLCLK